MAKLKLFKIIPIFLHRPNSFFFDREYFSFVSKKGRERVGKEERKFAPLLVPQSGRRGRAKFGGPAAWNRSG